MYLFIQIQTRTKVSWISIYSYHEQCILLFSCVIDFIFKAVLTHWIVIITHYWVATPVFKAWSGWSLVLQRYDSSSSWKLPPALGFPPPLNSLTIYCVFCSVQNYHYLNVLYPFGCLLGSLVREKSFWEQEPNDWRWHRIVCVCVFYSKGPEKQLVDVSSCC